MDGSHHLERNGGDLQEDAGKIAIGERLTFSSQNRLQDPLLGAAGANSNDNALVRSSDPEVIAHVHVHERGHVEELATALMERIARTLDCDDVAVAFAERVVHLVDDRGERCRPPR